MDIFETIREVAETQISPFHRLPIDIAKKEQSAEEWYRSRMAFAQQHGPFCYPYAETVSADRAELLLSVNPDNRSFKAGKCAEMRASLIAEQWRLNGETIIVSIDGLLNDGQNRLKAVVETGISIRTFIVWGVERDSRRTVDTGTVRVAGDFIQMEGGLDGNQAGSIAKWMMLYERNIYQDNRCNTHVPTRPEVTAFWMLHKDEIHHAISFIRRKSANEFRGITAPCVAYLITSKKSRADADYFFNLVCDGVGEGWVAGSAAVAIRMRLIAEKKKRTATGEKIELILRAWNFYRSGKKNVVSIPILKRYPEVE